MDDKENFDCNIKTALNDLEVAGVLNKCDDQDQETIAITDSRGTVYNMVPHTTDQEDFEPGTIPDSGARREFSTGSVRDIRIGKGRFDLISPIALKRLAKHYENGAVKYGDRNWEKGQPLMSYIDSAQRHLNEWILNKLTGKKDEEDHLAAVLWNISSFIHTYDMIKKGYLPNELNDIPEPFISEMAEF